MQDWCFPCLYCLYAFSSSLSNERGRGGSEIRSSSTSPLDAMSDETPRNALSELAGILERNGEVQIASRVMVVANGTDVDLKSFLVSNDLWGGPGSIADQGCLRSGERNSARRDLERVLVRIGRWQIQRGCVNPRTGMWVKAFEKWAAAGI